MNNSVSIEIVPMSLDQSLVRDHHTRDYRKDLFHWTGIATLNWDDKKLKVVVFAKSKEEGRTENEKKQWSDRLRLATAKAVDGEFISAFKLNEVTYSVPSPLPDPVPSDASASPSDTYIEQLNKEYEHDRAARESFDFAVDRLRERMGGSPEANDLFYFLQQSIAAADMGTMSGWYMEKMTGIASYMRQLETRKNRNHPGYIRARDYIQSQLFSFSQPDAWIDYPPILDKRS
ncbi:hypothetical protein [uncultured Rubinisphaera sp.]|uniref:hypothetical protein n=1 Tax=uncultured Rubinisphaera sp. TaxID=1678686 RepID=UPI0030D82D51|tara:strand:- start:443 stop:1138 length:696 start_codon:yes stop_codon:yes gene_type:complete